MTTLLTTGRIAYCDFCAARQPIHTQIRYEIGAPASARGVCGVCKRALPITQPQARDIATAALRFADAAYRLGVAIYRDDGTPADVKRATRERERRCDEVLDLIYDERR